ncbi:hypothetical protein JCM9957A_09600 [Kineosporia succinea]
MRPGFRTAGAPSSTETTQSRQAGPRTAQESQSISMVPLRRCSRALTDLSWIPVDPDGSRGPTGSLPMTQTLRATTDSLDFAASDLPRRLPRPRLSVAGHTVLV